MADTLVYATSSNVTLWKDYLFQTANGNISIYELAAGELTSSNQNFSIVDPAFYVTNISDTILNSINDTDILYDNLKSYSNQLYPLFENREPFVGGVVALSFVISGIVTAAWMLFVLLLLSSNTLPNSLLLTNLFYCVGHSVLLAKLTDVLRAQVLRNIADTNEVQKLVSSSTGMLVIRYLAVTFLYITWVDLVIQMNRYEARRKIIVFGLSLTLLATAFNFTFVFVSRETTRNSTTYMVTKVFHYFFSLLGITVFNFEVLRYSFKKRKFAYHKKVLALAIFCLLTMVQPYIFTIFDLANEPLRVWSTYVSGFSRLCAAVVVWEWLHTIRTLEVKNERKTVLGRRISNDSFAQPKPGQNEDSSTQYILKTLNVVGLLVSLRLKVKSLLSKGLHDTDRHRNVRVTDSAEGISLYPMAETESRHSSTSERTGVSLIGDYPQFDIDHRFLRNTPSTVPDTSRTTPLDFHTNTNGTITHPDNDHT